jgi:putative phosphoribosyl transferase
MRDEVFAVAAEWLLDHFARALPEPPLRHTTGTEPFRDRRDAGVHLAALLSHCDPRTTVVLGMPRGGVIVAGEIARRLGVPLDVWLARKIGMPIQPELGMGALSEGAALVLDPTMLRWSGATRRDIQRIVHARAAEIRVLASAYRGSDPPLALDGRTAVIVDDGIANAALWCASVRGARRRGASTVIVAAPVAAADAYEVIAREADEVVCVATPRNLMAVASWFEDFRPVSDLDVVAELNAKRRARWLDA